MEPITSKDKVIKEVLDHARWGSRLLDDLVFLLQIIDPVFLPYILINIQRIPGHAQKKPLACDGNLPWLI
jgi:hypothetical protein